MGSHHRLLLSISCLVAGLFLPARATTVSTQAQLTSALVTGNTVDLAADIYLSSTITITGLTSLVINGHGYKVDGQSSVLIYREQRAGHLKPTDRDQREPPQTTVLENNTIRLRMLLLKPVRSFLNHLRMF